MSLPTAEQPSSSSSVQIVSGTFIDTTWTMGISYIERILKAIPAGAFGSLAYNTSTGQYAIGIIPTGNWIAVTGTFVIDNFTAIGSEIAICGWLNRVNSNANWATIRSQFAINGPNNLYGEPSILFPQASIVCRRVS